MALAVIIILVVLLAALVITIPILLNVDRYRPRVVEHIRKETGKPAEIGQLALTLFPKLSIRVNDFALGNPAGFPPGYLLQVRRIYAELDAHALWNRQIVIKSLELTEPLVSVFSDVHGRWNFENTPKERASEETPREEPPPFSLGTIAKVSLNNGHVIATNLLDSGKAGPAYFDASGVSSQLQNVDLNAFVSSSSSALLGTGPEPFRAGWGQRLWGSSRAYAASSPSQPAAKGTLSAQSLRIRTLQVTGVKTKIRLFPKRLFLDDPCFELYGGHARGSLTFDFAGENPAYSATARLDGVDVGRLLAAFPEARGKMSGKMEGQLKLSGEVKHSSDPLAGMRGTGEVRLRNGRLPTLQLNKNLMLLARFSNLGPASGDPSSFSTISADVNIANGQLTSKKIVIIGNGVNLDGSGTLSLARAGSLDYQGIAQIAAQPSPLVDVLVNLTGASFANGKLSFPLSISGTLDNPRFALKSAGRAGQFGAAPNVAAGKTGQQITGQPGQAQQQPADVVQGIIGLLKKRSQQPQQSPKQSPK